jgi:hypothetical protein
MLVLHINRFENEWKKTRKNSDRFPFDEYLKFSSIQNALREVASNTATGNHKAPVYRLHSVVCHTGTLDNGHYKSFIRDESQWYCCNDAEVTTVDSSQAIDGTFGSSESNCFSAYMLFYEVCSDDHKYSRSPITSSKSSDCILISSPPLPEPKTARRYELPPLPPLPSVPATSSGRLDNFWNQNECFALTCLRAEGNIPAYVCKFPTPESLQTSGQPIVNDAHCRTPFTQDRSTFINDACIDWFFMALTALFPAYMYLPCTVCGFKQQPTLSQVHFINNWKANFFCRLPHSVLLPVNLPSHYSSCISVRNPGFHWVLIAIKCHWSKLKLSKISVICMDSLVDDHCLKAAGDWFNDSILPVFSQENSHLCKVQIAAGLKRRLQLGNSDCGAYIMAFGLNYVMGTLETMPDHFGPDASAVGQELRKMAAWDSVQDPPLLDACLYMCPLFQKVAVNCHEWWSVSCHYDLCKSLNIKLESMDTFSICGYSTGFKRGSRFMQEFSFDSSSICVENRIATDGPFFFSNKDYFVKVYCIGLVNHFQHDKVSVRRARRAFHEASATDYGCKKAGWFCKSFGLICVGLATPCCFVCVARSKLEQPGHLQNSPDIGQLVFNITSQMSVGKENERLSAVHNDVHFSNLMWNPIHKRYEIVDFERMCLLLGVRRPSAWFYSLYASSVASKNVLLVDILMHKLKRSGLDSTSDFFSGIYEKKDFLNMAFDEHFFATCPKTEWTYDAFLHLFELLFNYNPIISGQVLSPSVTFTIESCAYAISLVRFEDGHAKILSLTINSQNPSSFTLPIELRSDSDTDVFFNNLTASAKPLNASSDSSELRYSFQVVLDDDDSFGGTPDVEDHSHVDFKVQEKKRQKVNPHDQEVPDSLFLRKKMIDVGNEDVLESIKESMQRRFATQGALQNFFLRSSKSEPLNALRPEHFGCEIVLVRDEPTFDRCINFISTQQFLSFDTESTTPTFSNNGISLIQIGTTRIVFIIQVVPEFKFFLPRLGSSLNNKTLLCWGDDANAIGNLLPCCEATFIDVQAIFSNPSQKKGLASATAELFAEKYVLDKAWTLSGWDNPILTKGQLRYATLDVVCCHALYAAYVVGKDSVYETDDHEYITFYARDISKKDASKMKHGFSFTSTFLGHYTNGVMSRGFTGPALHPTGFVALDETSHGKVHVDVSAFVKLLNDSKFCCALCSRCSVLQKKWNFFAISPFKIFSFMKSTNQAALKVSVQNVSNDSDEQRSYYCVSMLASFFQMSVSASQLQSLKMSVCSDIFYGYIRETLAHLI